ncbi:MAG TPA: prolipoprotein diacylglyceryl transferase [Candidatus Methylomirabilis sp.]|nr:prolipoprotein diacylglyceryl transferase [Candidatus Methylomirabilis sp.]
MFPILFSIGGFHLRAYGTLIAIAVLTGTWLAGQEAVRKGIPKERVQDFVVWATLFGLLGARLYYLAFAAPQVFLQDPLGVLAIWRGGLAIHGALLAGAATAVWYVRRHRLSFWRFADTLAPSVILGQAIGRLACFLNGDAYGIPTTLPWAVTFTNPAAMAPLGVPLHPTQLYEMGLNLILFALLWWWRTRIRFDGQLFLLYVGGYGTIRFIVENFRGDQLQYAGGISAAQSISLVVLTVAGTLLALRARPTSTPSRDSQ